MKMILKDFSKICEDNNIEYYLTQKFANKLNSNKVSAELENRKSLIITLQKFERKGKK